MIVKHKSARISTPAPGVVRRILANSAKLMLTEHTLVKGAVLPDHKHPHEQLVYLLSGAIRLEMNGDILQMAAGDSLVIPSNMTHKVTALENTVALDIFTPAREDYL
jgi:quercetin dioxygenase-like cupin family protein